VPKDVWAMITKMAAIEEVCILQLTRTGAVTEIGYYRDSEECYKIASQLCGSTLICNNAGIKDNDVRDLYKLLYEMERVTKIGNYTFPYPSSSKELFAVLVGYIKHCGGSPMVHVISKRIH
jgi:hypothetical protein